MSIQILFARMCSNDPRVINVRYYYQFYYSSSSYTYFLLFVYVVNSVVCGEIFQRGSYEGRSITLVKIREEEKLIVQNGIAK
jgi:hypothetical protein